MMDDKAEFIADAIADVEKRIADMKAAYFPGVGGEKSRRELLARLEDELTKLRQEEAKHGSNIPRIL